MNLLDQSVLCCRAGGTELELHTPSVGKSLELRTREDAVIIEVKAMHWAERSDPELLDMLDKISRAWLVTRHQVELQIARGFVNEQEDACLGFQLYEEEVQQNALIERVGVLDSHNGGASEPLLLGHYLLTILAKELKLLLSITMTSTLILRAGVWLCIRN